MTDDLNHPLWISDKEEITEDDCAEYFEKITDPCNKVDTFLALLEHCKLACAVAESRAEENSRTAGIWEQRYKIVQGYGFRLLKDSIDGELVGSRFSIKGTTDLPQIKSSITRRFSTDWMIPDELVFSVPERYRQVKVIWELRDDLVKRDLVEGKRLNFAKLLDSKRLHIVKFLGTKNATDK